MKHALEIRPQHLLLYVLLLCPQCLWAQEGVRYTGTTLSDPTSHDGRLSPAVGVHNIQVMRAWRERPSARNGWGWTYNHQPMLAYWGGRFWLHYLSDEKDEQVPPSRTLLLSSRDGYTWTEPRVLFPEYDVPEGFTKPGIAVKAHNIKAVMHQRMGFYTSKAGRLYALGTYGVCLTPKDHNNDGNGIGRVMREIKADGTLGPIYFIYYNHGFSEKNTDFPSWKRGDKALRRAVAEIYASPRVRMQWVEEADREDPLIPLNKDYKAYNDYTLPDGRIVALWKHALTSISSDGGLTWAQPVGRAPGFVNSNAKIWGQRLTDGTYATVYNPSEFRWPLALSLSKDGLDYTTLSLVTGEVPPMRYGGNYKSFGPQYVRGIQEGNGEPRDSDLWVAYSMNKEDIWVAHIPVPVRLAATAHADDDFSKLTKLGELTDWNIYSPQEAPVSLSGEWLTLTDGDRHDYCRVERMIPATGELAVEFDIKAAQTGHGWLQMELLDHKGTPCSRLEWTSEGELRCKGGARYARVCGYEAGRTYHIRAEISVARRQATIYVDGKKAAVRMLFAPVESVERVMLRTGTQRLYPTIDTPADWDGILPQTGDTVPRAVFQIARFRTMPLIKEAEDGAVLHYKDFEHHIAYFNQMEDENIRQAIPNDSAWAWMTENVPLFECSDPQFEQMAWFRWWTLRKHLEQTPAGWAMTEFLVNRNYADRWKLIASAVGHHIHESRWLRNPEYLDQIIRTWYHGGEGGAPMAKFLKYSSWVPQSIWERYLVSGRRDWVIAQLRDMEWDCLSWLTTHRLASGLIWQEDVKDAMEETISGGRKKQYARPSVNAYVWGGADAVSRVATLAGDTAKAAHYRAVADTLRRLTESLLWDERQQFFETRRYYEGGDSSAAVREAIGFMPWYVKMPIDNAKYGVAWQQLADEQGFNAPYGVTTAERRHPLFRSHGTGQCEWDGAVWPFATSQVLTGYINYLNQTQRPRDGASLFYQHMLKYVQSQHKRGIPYIGEYLDETTGYWLKGDQERSRYYNHSTFNDLLITGLCGLQPQEGDTLVVNPLLPDGTWQYFCLDRVRYHGHDITILWDADGQRYHQGAGLTVLVDGHKRAHRPTLGALTLPL